MYLLTRKDAIRGCSSRSGGQNPYLSVTGDIDRFCKWRMPGARRARAITYRSQSNDVGGCALPDEIQINILNIVVEEGAGAEDATLNLRIGDETIRVPISRELKAYFEEQFVRPNPTPQQRRRYSTLMNLLRSAYMKGRQDAGR